MSSPRKYGFIELNPDNTPDDMPAEFFRSGTVYYAEKAGSRIVSLLALLKSGKNPDEIILYGIYTSSMTEADELAADSLEKKGYHPLRLLFGKAYIDLKEMGYRYMRARLIGDIDNLGPYYITLRKEYFIPVSLNNTIGRENRKDIIKQEWIRDLYYVRPAKTAKDGAGGNKTKSENKK